jgi:hypothetical protein
MQRPIDTNERRSTSANLDTEVPSLKPGGLVTASTVVSWNDFRESMTCNISLQEAHCSMQAQDILVISNKPNDEDAVLCY